jgi:Luciferase-like monooxygenase
MEREYEYLRADFRRRGRLADEYIAAIRELFESDAPEFRGEHVSYKDALFSPRPKVPIPIVVGGNSRAALERAVKHGDGWHGLKLSPESARAAIVTMDALGHKENFAVWLRCRPGSAGPLTAYRLMPRFAVSRARSSSRSTGTPTPASINWSSSSSRATCRTSWINLSGSPEK